MASKSDAPFRDAKTKLLEIRSQLSKRVEARADTKGEKRKKKKQKKDDGHVWSWFLAYKMLHKCVNVIFICILEIDDAMLYIMLVQIL